MEFFLLGEIDGLVVREFQNWLQPVGSFPFMKKKALPSPQIKS